MGITSTDSDARIRALEDEVRDLRKQMSRLPVRYAIGNGSGGGFSIVHYDTFPPIPEVPTIIDCKDQLWFANANYTFWKPCVEYTPETGVVGT